MELGTNRGMRTRMQIDTVPGQVYYAPGRVRIRVAQETLGQPQAPTAPPTPPLSPATPPAARATPSLAPAAAPPVSAYQANGLYVSTAVQGTLQVPMPAQFERRGGVGYRWNDYRMVAVEIGEPRADRILGWYVGLRRPLRHNLYLAGAYRSEDRTSNVGTFTTDADGCFQLEWDIFGDPKR